MTPTIIYTSSDSDVISSFLSMPGVRFGRHAVGQGNVNPLSRVNLISLFGDNTKLF